MNPSLNDQYRKSVTSEQLRIGFGPGFRRSQVRSMFGAVAVQGDVPRRSAIDVSSRPRDLRPRVLGQYGFTSGLVNGVFGYGR